MPMYTTSINNTKGENDMNRLDHSHIHPKGHAMHPHHVHPAPPHERRAMLHLFLDEKDQEVLLAVFGDQDSAAAAESIIYEAPPEVQILAIQSLSMAEQFVRLSESQPEQQVMENSQETSSCETVENRARMSCPVLGESAKRLFDQLYGETGDGFYTVLGSAPYEIAVIARILAYLNEKAGEINGYH